MLAPTVRRFFHGFILGCLSLFFFARCDITDRPTVESRDALRVGALPDRNHEDVKRQFGPLLAHIQSHTGFQVELRVPSSYQQMLDDFHAKRLDMAHFGAVTFVLAEERSQAVPLATRDVDLEFTSDFIVRSDSPAHDIRDLKEHVLMFGPQLSTSGHLMPRHYLSRLRIAPESYFSEVRFSSGHDATIQAIRRGEADLGAVNSVVLETMAKELQGEIRVLQRTTPFTNYVWSVQADLDPLVRTSLLEAFLALNPADPSDAALLSALGAQVFLPASSADYEEVRAAVELSRPVIEAVQ